MGIPNIPPDVARKHVGNHMLYVYFPIRDVDLPDLNKLHALAKLGARLVANGEKVLTHCGLGFNRSALVAGLALSPHCADLEPGEAETIPLLQISSQGICRVVAQTYSDQLFTGFKEAPVFHKG